MQVSTYYDTVEYEIRITSVAMYALGKVNSYDTYVHYRINKHFDWELAKNNLDYATPGQLLKNISLLKQKS